MLEDSGRDFFFWSFRIRPWEVRGSGLSGGAQCAGVLFVEERWRMLEVAIEA